MPQFGCTNCGELLDGAWDECKHCGQNIDNTMQGETVEVEFEKEVDDEWLEERNLSAAPSDEEPHTVTVTAHVDEEVHECDECEINVDWDIISVEDDPCDEHLVDQVNFKDYRDNEP